MWQFYVLKAAKNFNDDKLPTLLIKVFGLPLVNTRTYAVFLNSLLYVVK